MADGRWRGGSQIPLGGRKRSLKATGGKEKKVASSRRMVRTWEYRDHALAKRTRRLDGWGNLTGPAQEEWPRKCSEEKIPAGTFRESGGGKALTLGYRRNVSGEDP